MALPGRLWQMRPDAERDSLKWMPVQATVTRQFKSAGL